MVDLQRAEFAGPKRAGMQDVLHPVHRWFDCRLRVGAAVAIAANCPCDGGLGRKPACDVGAPAQAVADHGTICLPAADRNRPWFFAQSDGDTMTPKSGVKP